VSGNVCAAAEIPKGQPGKSERHPTGQGTLKSWHFCIPGPAHFHAS